MARLVLCLALVVLPGCTTMLDIFVAKPIGWLYCMSDPDIQACRETED